MSEEQNQEPEVLLENYGTTALPVPESTPIHCLTIIGQIEGHMFCPKITKQPNMNICIPN